MKSCSHTKKPGQPEAGYLQLNLSTKFWWNSWIMNEILQRQVPAAEACKAWIMKSLQFSLTLGWGIENCDKSNHNKTPEDEGMLDHVITGYQQIFLLNIFNNAAWLTEANTTLHLCIMCCVNIIKQLSSVWYHNIVSWLPQLSISPVKTAHW